jgi:hypothetical protein
MKRAIFFAIIAALLLVPCAVAYGYDKVKAADIEASIEAADPTLVPNINVFGNTIGNVTAGDLFIIDLSGTTTDAAFALYMTNIDELTHNYKFMTLNIGIYVQTDIDGWEKMTAVNGGVIPEMYITMQSGQVTFSLPGNARYKVTIEKGSFRSFSITKGESVAIPQFCLATS